MLKIMITRRTAVELSENIASANARPGSDLFILLISDEAGDDLAHALQSADHQLATALRC